MLPHPYDDACSCEACTLEWLIREAEDTHQAAREKHADNPEMTAALGQSETTLPKKSPVGFGVSGAKKRAAAKKLR